MRPIAHTNESQVRAAIVSALHQLRDGDEAKRQLLADGVRELVVEMAAENDMALAALEREGKPSVAVLNSPNLVHFGLLVEAGHDAIRLLAKAALSPHAAKFFPNSGIWKPYAVAVSAFLWGESLDLPPCKPKGYEKHMVPYIDFMMASTEDERRQAKQGIADSFEVRNRDRRCRDWFGLDGDGEQPVKWDLRLYTLEAHLASV
ncbi:hypothetical protein Pla175_28460 [Pirellulimonas nuda]|uniref:Uncharacterized protein n=1 Tax=Pirellulimonas nuda TaxID=2528009 RepID=A0A518DDE1_9BACT|nr:hypothetical protein [Pirellulimonas nuda]QDU89456.1 hypothetical protein Pla175_28460 [Pirellulimonas nuda]